MKKSGISLIALIITIIVIIILAAISIFGVAGVVEKSRYAKFVSDMSEMQTAVSLDYANRKQKYILSGEFRTDEEIYYMIATGKDITGKEEVKATGKVEYIENEIYPSLQGTEYYEITDDRNIAGWERNQTYASGEEKHYITNKGEVFILPGYTVEQKDGINLYFVNANQYYDNTKFDARVLEKVKVGDYVDYENYVTSAEYDTDASKTGYTSSQHLETEETLNWRILSISDSGIWITTDGPALTNSVALRGAIGYYNGPEELHNICQKLYSSEELNLRARCMVLEDIERAFGYTQVAPTDNNRYAFYPNEAGEQSGTIEYNGNTYKKIRLDSGKYPNGRFLATEIDGGGKAGEIDDGKTEEGYDYVEMEANNPVYITETHDNDYNPTGPDAQINSKVRSILEPSWGWLASPCICVYGNTVVFEMRVIESTCVGSDYMYWAHNGIDSHASYLRPVVLLKSNIKIDVDDTTTDGSSPEKAWKLGI